MEARSSRGVASVCCVLGMLSDVMALVDMNGGIRLESSSFNQMYRQT